MWGAKLEVITTNFYVFDLTQSRKTTIEKNYNREKPSLNLKLYYNAIMVAYSYKPEGNKSLPMVFGLH